MSQISNCESDTSISDDEGGNTSSIIHNPNTNPHFGNRMHLHCRTNHFLAIHPDGSVKGSTEKNDYTKLELIATGFGGQLMIKGCKTRLFLAINMKGFIYATDKTKDECTIFYQGVRGFYQTYKSKKFDPSGWYLGIKKTGEVKNGKKTAPEQKSVHYQSVRF